MLLTTTGNIEGRQIKEYLGIVTGTYIYLVGGLIGGGLASQENLYSSAISYATMHMTEKARALGADAIVGISTNFTSPGNLNHMIVAVSGTAVLTNVAYDAKQKVIQDQIDRENAAKEEERRANQALRDAFENLGESSQLTVFLDQAAKFERVSEVNNLWKSLEWEDNAVYTSVEAKISQAFKIERMYGHSSGDVSKLLSEINTMLNASDCSDT